jgi:hypothetical protein
VCAPWAVALGQELTDIALLVTVAAVNEGVLAEHVLDRSAQRLSWRFLLSRMDFSRPERCRWQRTGRENRRSNFYEIPDNLRSRFENDIAKDPQR